MVRDDVTSVATIASVGGYESPEVKVLHLQTEGVLCSSGLTEQFEEGEFNWN